MTAVRALRYAVRQSWPWQPADFARGSKQEWVMPRCATPQNIVLTRAHSNSEDACALNWCAALLSCRAHASAAQLLPPFPFLLTPQVWTSACAPPSPPCSHVSAVRAQAALQAAPGRASPCLPTAPLCAVPHLVAAHAMARASARVPAVMACAVGMVRAAAEGRPSKAQRLGRVAPALRRTTVLRLREGAACGCSLGGGSRLYRTL